MENVQNKNKGNPNVNTADSSVFENLMVRFENKQQQADDPASSYIDIKVQLDALKAQIAEQAKAAEINDIPRPNLSTVGSTAITNSNSGTLGSSTEPNMDSPMREMRIPDNSRSRVLDYSQNKIVLDGKESRFKKIEYNSQLGWVLES